MSQHLKDPSHNFPCSFFFPQENRTIVIKMETLGGPEHTESTICSKTARLLKSLPPPPPRPPPPTMNRTPSLQLCRPNLPAECRTGLRGAGSPSEPKWCELHHLGHYFFPEQNKHWRTYHREQACPGRRARCVTGSRSSLAFSFMFLKL